MLRLAIRGWRHRSILSQATPPAPSSARANVNRLLSQTLLSQRRLYASKAKGKQQKRNEKVPQEQRTKRIEDTGKLVPGSQQILVGEDQAEFEKAETKMQAAVDWFRREVTSMEMQGSGRVTPDVLKPVRIVLPGAGDTPPVKLTDVATVGVREGTTLIVTVFEESSVKHVEKAIFAAQIPHVAPQRLDSRTLKIPMPKPTVDARSELVKSAAKHAEDTRVQLRRMEQTSVKKGRYEKRSVQLEQFHELLQKHVKDVDKILGDLKKTLGVK